MSQSGSMAAAQQLGQPGGPQPDPCAQWPRQQLAQPERDQTGSKRKRYVYYH